MANATRLWTLKAFASGLLLAMLCMVLYCPCKRLLCCHLGWFYAMVAALVGVVFLENGPRISCG